MNRWFMAMAAIAGLACATSTQAASNACTVAAVPLDQLQLVDPTFSPSKLRGGEPAMVTLVTVRNDTETAVEGMQIEVRYFDADRKHIDTLVDTVYASVPAHGELGVRVRGSAAQAVERYASQTLRVVSAEAQGACPPGTLKPDPWIDTLKSCAPVLLLGVFVAIAMRSMRRPNLRIADFYDRQLALIEAQNRDIARIAAASERQAPGGEA